MTESIGENMEQTGILMIASETAKWYTLENNLAVSYKGKHILTIWPNNSTPMDTLEKYKHS